MVSAILVSVFTVRYSRQFPFRMFGLKGCSVCGCVCRLVSGLDLQVGRVYVEVVVFAVTFVVVVVVASDSFSDAFDEPSDDVEPRGVRESDLTEAVICAGPRVRIGWSTSNFGPSTKRRRIMRSLASSLLSDSSNRICSALLVIATFRSSSSSITRQKVPSRRVF